MHLDELTTTFPADADQLAGVRAFAQRSAEALGATVDREVLAVIVGELAANAVRHQDGEVAIAVRRLAGGDLEIAVCDSDPGLPVLGERNPWHLGGRRGIALVAALSSAWGVEERGDHKRVWARLSPPTGPDTAPYDQRSNDRR